MRWKHKVRGSLYKEVGKATIQCAAPIQEGQEVVVYQDAQGRLYARPMGEFLDGRFDAVPWPKTDDVLTMDQVFDCIWFERQRQDAKWGTNKPQSLPGFIAVVQHEAREAMTGWVKNSFVHGRDAPLNELVQVAATAVAALQRYGVDGSATSTNDIPHIAASKEMAATAAKRRREVEVEGDDG
jgi:hypothetical protein